LQVGGGRWAVAADAAKARHLEESAQTVRNAVAIGRGLGGGKLVMPAKHLLSDELRDRAREAGLKVTTGVVDDPEEQWPRARFDLYGMASNRPGVVLEGIREDG
jgi:hypothetical protein